MCKLLVKSARELKFSSLQLGKLTLIEIRLDVIDELDADRQTNEILGNTAGRLLLVSQLLVRRRGRVDHERLRVAHVCQVRGQLQTVNKGGASSGTTLDAKREHTSETILEVLLGQFVAGVACQTWVGDPRHARVALEVLCDSKGVVHVPLHSQAQSLETLKKQEGAEGVESGTEVTKHNDSHVNGVSDGLESFVELEAVVALGWLGELGKLARSSPVEFCRMVEQSASN